MDWLATISRPFWKKKLVLLCRGYTWHLFQTLLLAILPWRLWDLIPGDLSSTPSLEALPGWCPDLRLPSQCTAGPTGFLSMRLGDDQHEASGLRGKQDTVPRPAGVLPARNRQTVWKQTLYSYSSELRHFNILFKIFFKYWFECNTLFLYKIILF